MVVGLRCRVVSRGVIDLHFHALPGLDDGPNTRDDALALCAAAAADGTEMITATPHINFEYPEIDAATMQAGVQTMRQALQDAGIGIDLRPGAEVALTRAMELPDHELRRLTLDGGPTLLLELPWQAGGTGMAAAVSRISERGFQILLAHPERTPMLRDDLGLVRDLLLSGACCCVNAASLSERAARRTRAVARRLLADGLVHAVVSDAHDTAARRPAVRSILRGEGMSAAEITFFTEEGPRALLRGVALDPPAPGGGRRRVSLPWNRS